VVWEIIGPPRRTILFDIAGGCAKHETDRGQASRNQAGILQYADTERKIKPFLDQVNEAIIERDIDHDLGVAGEIVGERGTQLRDPERDGRRKVQHAARRGLQRAGALPNFVDLAENAFAPFVNQRPDLGDVEAARGAI